MRAAFFVVLLGLLAAASAGRSYRHHVLVEMTLAEDTVSELASVFADLDVWDQRGNTIELLLTPNQYVSLQDLNLPHTVKVQDMSRVIFEERRRIVERTRDGKDMWEPGREGGFFDEFRTYADYETYMNDLVALYPDLLSHYDAGVTFEGRTIKGVKVSVSNSTDRAALYFEAAQHAREWLAPPTNLWILTSFVEDYEAGNNDVVNLLRAFDMYFIPVVNVDGYLHTWAANGDRLWRKNRRVNSNGSVGVDLNRNWGPDDTWCTAGSSTLPSSDTYCGTAPFSEPETSSMRDNLHSIPNLKGGIDFHTYGPLLLHPFQYTYDSAPEPYRSLVLNLGLDMEDAINSVHNQRYESIQGSDLYPHSGGFIDYVYFNFEVPAYTIELRGNSFVVPPENIILSGEENYEGVLVFANAIYANL